MFVFLQSARLGHMFQTEGVSNVKGFAKTAHLVIKLQENVIMDVVCIGQEHFVKVHSFENFYRKMKMKLIECNKATC